MSRPRVEILEVGPRDGLQSLSRTLGVDHKLAMIRSVADAGIQRIEAGSYVSRKAIPQMADTAKVVAAVAGVANLEVLVVNRAGAVQAAEGAADTLVALLAASETFAANNTRNTIAEGITHATEISRLAADSGKACVATVSTAFGCAYEGPVAPEAVVRVAAGALAADITEVTLCDTVGMASPTQVYALAELLRSELGDACVLGLHLHDTRGLALANAMAGLAAGVRLFDASIGGLGGCPFSPGATGNVSTEDLVHLLEIEGFATGVDLEALVRAGSDIAGWIEVPSQSAIAVAGPAWSVGPCGDRPARFLESDVGAQS